MLCAGQRVYISHYSEYVLSEAPPAEAGIIRGSEGLRSVIPVRRFSPAWAERAMGAEPIGV